MNIVVVVVVVMSYFFSCLFSLFSERDVLFTMYDFTSCVVFSLMWLAEWWSTSFSVRLSLLSVSFFFLFL